ncbi:MAG: AAA family ATPase, partial [Polyangiaceae bacterium]|nr:AAA family ATPase [Polyangiaceae bacterium]
YKNLFLLDEDNRLRRIDLGKIHSSAAPSIVDLVLSRLRQEDLLTEAVSVRTLVENWPPALPAWSTRSIRDAFYASPRLPRLSNPEILKNTVARGVSDGQLAYATEVGDLYDPFVFGRTLTGADVEIADTVVVLRKDDALLIQQAIEAGKPPKPSTHPPPRIGGGGDVIRSGGAGGSTPPPPSVSGRTVGGLRWEGEVPWQKWNQFYSKVVSRFSMKGVKLRVVVEVTPAGGMSEQDLEATRAALKEIGLSSDITEK